MLWEILQVYLIKHWGAKISKIFTVWTIIYLSHSEFLIDIYRLFLTTIIESCRKSWIDFSALGTYYFSRRTLLSFFVEISWFWLLLIIWLKINLVIWTILKVFDYEFYYLIIWLKQWQLLNVNLVLLVKVPLSELVEIILNYLWFQGLVIEGAIRIYITCLVVH